MSVKLSILIFLLGFIEICTASCDGRFINPITDICWDCLFPITIGAAEVVPSDYPDTPNPSMPVGVCPIEPVGVRIGLNIGYWEPTNLVDVTRIPFCFVNLGGFKIDLGVGSGIGGKQSPAVGAGSFYHVHLYKYPLIYWLQIIMDIGCMQIGDFDIAYLTELDPTWNDDELSFILNPEAALFGDPITQTACAAESVKTSTGKLPIDKLFWCAGSLGSIYPLTGNIAKEKSPIQAATLLNQRIIFKMHRLGLIRTSTGKGSPESCYTKLTPIMPKSRYRYQMINIIPKRDRCFPFSRTVIDWESFHNQPASKNNFGFLVWKKRNCVFL